MSVSGSAGLFVLLSVKTRWQNQLGNLKAQHRESLKAMGLMRCMTLSLWWGIANNILVPPIKEKSHFGSDGCYLK